MYEMNIYVCKYYCFLMAITFIYIHYGSYSHQRIVNIIKASNYSNEPEEMNCIVDDPNGIAIISFVFSHQPFCAQKVDWNHPNCCEPAGNGGPVESLEVVDGYQTRPSKQS